MCLINIVKIWSWNTSFEPCNRRNKLQEAVFFMFGIFLGMHVGFKNQFKYFSCLHGFLLNINCILITLENILLILSTLRLFLPSYQVAGNLQDLSVGHKAAKGKN